MAESKKGILQIKTYWVILCKKNGCWYWGETDNILVGGFSMLMVWCVVNILALLKVENIVDTENMTLVAILGRWKDNDDMAKELLYTEVVIYTQEIGFITTKKDLSWTYNKSKLGSKGFTAIGIGRYSILY